MGRIADDAQARTVKKGPQCGTGLLLKVMDPEDRADFETLMAGSTPGTILAATVKEYYPADAPGAASINTHRRGLCRCSG